MTSNEKRCQIKTRKIVEEIAVFINRNKMYFAVFFTVQFVKSMKRDTVKEQCNHS